MEGKHSPVSTRRSIITILVCVIVIGAVVGILLVWVPGLPGPRHGAYIVVSHLTNIGARLRSYNDLRGHLPAATATDTKSGERSSWRIEVYESFVRDEAVTRASGNTNVSSDYDRHRAWNDPGNLRIQDRGAWYFRDASVSSSPPGANDHATSYKAITGPDTAFGTVAPRSLKDLPGSLILVVRVEESSTHWMQPDDLNVEKLAPSQATKQLLLGKQGYAMLFADGKVWVLSVETPISDLCKFFTLTGAKNANRDQLLGRYRVLP